MRSLRGTRQRGAKMSVHRVRARALAPLGTLAVALCAALPAAAGATTNYVAMGDSYTSGPGILPYVPSAPPECGQSELNYPHLVAAALNLSLTDVSCGGAKTEDFTVAQDPDQPPQFDALTESTEVVTVGMGGNDGNLFGTLVEGCTYATFEHPFEKSPCKTKYEAFVKLTFTEDKAPREKALEEMHALSPKAKIFVVGYPEITPKDGECVFSEFPWKSGDLKWFRKTEQLGNKLIEESAKAHGAIFVNTFKPSEGHNACAGVGTRWIEPLVGSLTGVAVHPNAMGQRNDAYDLEESMLKARVR